MDTETGTELTAKGRVVVGQRIESVNADGPARPLEQIGNDAVAGL